MNDVLNHIVYFAFVTVVIVRDKILKLKKMLRRPGKTGFKWE